MTSILRMGIPGALLFLAALASTLGAQELPLERELPPSEEAAPCRAYDGIDPPPVGEEDRAEARRLASEASRAMILGETAEARALLEEAVELDPAAPDLRFQLGRAREGSGEAAAALEAFCAYLALAPDGPERADVEARVEALAPPPARQIPDAARRAFTDGVAHFDRGAWDEAVREFSRALVEHPDWDVAHYNRGLAYLRAGREGAGLSDLEQYLELAPQGDQAQRVRDRLAAASPPAERGPNPGTAFAVGIVMPGMGHFYSGRPGMGMLYLVGAGASAATGLLYRQVEVSCRTIPGPDGCPPDQIAEERESQPLLVPGLAGAAGLTLLGAVHAYVGARRRSGSAPGAPGLQLVGAGGTALSVEPALDRGVPGFRARVRIAF